MKNRLHGVRNQRNKIVPESLLCQAHYASAQSRVNAIDRANAVDGQYVPVPYFVAVRGSDLSCSACELGERIHRADFGNSGP